MPWNGSLLYVATWRIDEPINGNKVAGEAGIESICQPRWNETGKLFFTSDRTGYWQLYRVDVSNASPRHIHRKPSSLSKSEQRMFWLQLTGTTH